jgi:hypothetical protein
MPDRIATKAQKISVNNNLTLCLGALVAKNIFFDKSLMILPLLH